MPKENKDLKIAKKVIEQEIQGLKALYDYIGDEFIKAIELISSIKGRVIITGMGKSGHVSRKIAATLASTGTAAYFVHPAEASHGDLGMITSDDVVIALSNSGDTTELRDLIYYVKRFSIPLIAMVRKGNSALANAANIALVIPNIDEASEVNAPTTSTTMMLALGDAIAVTLLERKGFKKEDFSVLHPGGKLGSALLKVKDIMYSGKKIPLAHKSDKMSDILIAISEKGFGCIAILDDNEKLLGVITDGDLRRHMCDNFISLTADKVMTMHPLTINPDSLVAEALNIMNSRSITCLFVVKNDKVAGIIHIHDCLRVGIA